MTLTFKTYLDLESMRKQLSEAVDTGEFPEKVFAFLSTASSPYNEKDSWENSVFSFIEVVKKCKPKDIPLIKDAPKTESKSVPWEYEGRNWAAWSHILARAYGWTLEYIGSLDFNEALARIQEILTDEHLDREFVYSLSELAYPYNKSTKKSVFKPMSRPYWMKEAAPVLKKMKFRADMMPVGLIQDVSGMPADMNPLRDYVEFIHQKKTKKTDPPPSP